LADAIFVGVCRNLNKLPDNLRQRYDLLLQNKDFIDAVEQSTTDNEKVNSRIKIAIEAFSR
jgi:hypothetical protein